MKILFEKPPIWEEAKQAFKFDEKTTIFTYGDFIYNPGRIELEHHIIVHEETHGAQQKHDATVAKLWWQRYFLDSQFRVEQEVEAYGAQYRCICETVKDRNRRAKYLGQLAEYLSGPMYGNAIPYAQAKERIKRESGII